NIDFNAAPPTCRVDPRYIHRLYMVKYQARLAREEQVHHEQVRRILRKRRSEVRPVSASRYASGLRAGVRTSEPHKLIDTLVVGAYIEARSCERFEALVPHLDEELGK